MPCTETGIDEHGGAPYLGDTIARACFAVESGRMKHLPGKSARFFSASSYIGNSLPGSRMA
ncbi:MAG TPA: hypothetical protein VHE78_06735 [Gemmatimonadaceae bacterium]|nr:hypothetical protein [Gemmatimonadaceae bacterium]